MLHVLWAGGVPEDNPSCSLLLLLLMPALLLLRKRGMTTTEKVEWATEGCACEHKQQHVCACVCTCICICMHVCVRACLCVCQAIHYLCSESRLPHIIYCTP